MATRRWYRRPHAGQRFRALPAARARCHSDPLARSRPTVPEWGSGSGSGVGLGLGFRRPRPAPVPTTGLGSGAQPLVARLVLPDDEAVDTRPRSVILFCQSGDTMKTVAIKLPEDMLARVDRVSRARKLGRSEVIREALKQHLE